MSSDGRKKWSRHDIERLKQMRDSGMGLTEIAKRFSHPFGSCKNRFYDTKMALNRRTGYKTGVTISPTKKEIEKAKVELRESRARKMQNRSTTHDNRGQEIDDFLEKLRDPEIDIRTGAMI